MDDRLFENIFLAGFVIATIIRTYYGLQFKSKDVVHKKPEHPVVYAGIALWGLAVILPFISIYTTWLEIADFHIPVPINVIGSAVFFVGLWVLLQSHRDLEKNFSPSLFIRKNHTLVTTGIYKRIRHPMYLSFWLWSIGQALLIENWIAGPSVLIAFIPVYYFRVPEEEQQLTEVFGDEYTDYQKKTGRLFPRLW